MEIYVDNQRDVVFQIPRCYDLTVDYAAASAVKDLVDYILEPRREVRFGNRGFGKESRCVIRVWLSDEERDRVEDILQVNPGIGLWSLELTDFENSGRV